MYVDNIDNEINNIENEVGHVTNKTVMVEEMCIGTIIAEWIIQIETNLALTRDEY